MSGLMPPRGVDAVGLDATLVECERVAAKDRSKRSVRHAHEMVVACYGDGGTVDAEDSKTCPALSSGQLVSMVHATFTFFIDT